MVGRHSRGELRQDVPLPPLGDHDARRAELGEFGGDLEGADGTARDENTLAEVGHVPHGSWYVELAPAEPVKVSSPGTAGMEGDWNLPLATTTRSNVSVVPEWPTSQPASPRLRSSTRVPNRMRDVRPNVSA